MRRLMAMVIVILLLTPLLSEASAADKPQSLFMIDMTIRVSPVNVENASTWMGLFQIHAVLKDPGQRAYFQYLAANNSTKAREEFGDFVKQLIYDNMRDNIKRRFNAANVSGTIYLPPGGPVEVLNNWSAVVTFYLTNFLISDGDVLRCPLSGPLDFVYKGHVFRYTWDRLTLILPRGYGIKNLAPVPDDLSDGVAVWNGGYFIPLIELYANNSTSTGTRVLSYAEFLNSTRKEISLVYDPDEGYVQFNATFTGASATPSITSRLLASFRATMNVISMDAREGNGSLVIIGVARPEVAYQETSSERIWKAVVRLPGRFDNVSVRGGEYVLAPDNTLIITVKEKKSRLKLYAGGVAAVLVIAAVAILWKKRAGKGPETSGENPSSKTEPETEGNGGSEEPDGGGE
ncbi:hypothetical protein [Thermococcus celer]|uniref:Uncharacterized protein n=1 Tax=Thermococcus celer Vu 13 = JCM 8558 TaxID=1293037 RepID=A0A218P3A8_THECE|nr:hypothetical protein [Thermococcus celer]ASI99409.1 hypothetical protein A3L02_07500 [Thermococcus celer Vu 13 = JCM 8558]